MVKFKVKPSQKETWRYIAFEIISELEPAEKDVIRAITSSILKVFGETGASETNVWLIEYKEGEKKGILRCSNKALTEVLAALTSITKMKKKKAVFNTLGVSGTIKKLREKYF